MGTLGACAAAGVSLSTSDVQVSENDAYASFDVELSNISSDVVSVDYITSSGSALGGTDYVEVSTAQTLTFNPGEISKTVDVTLIQDTLVEGNETFTLLLSNAVNAALNTVSAQATIVDDETEVACGAPNYDLATEQAMFVWKDCVTGDWFLRTTAGGSPSAITYVGGITSGDGFEFALGRSLESNDVLDNATDPTVLVYSLAVASSFQDAINFRPVTEVGTCLTLDTPASGPILLGSSKTPISSPFDLGTLTVCP